MEPLLPVARDIFERVYSTFFQVLTAVLLSDTLNWQDYLSLDNWRGWVSAAAVAALTTLKGLLATQVGKWHGRAASASLDPGVKLAPVDAPGHVSGN